MTRKAKRTWERISFTIDSDPLTRAERIKHIDISYSDKKQRETAIARAAATAIPHAGVLTVDHATDTVFKYGYGQSLIPAATFTSEKIAEPRLEEEIADLFTEGDAA